MNVSQPFPARTTGRLRSLDIFRGMLIVAMILVNNPGPAVEVYPPLVHAEWDGWTFADTIFPSFLWIVGLAMTLSTARRMGSGKARWSLLAHAVQRSVLLVACGLFLEAFPRFDLASLQVTGVLQKIAVAYLLAFWIFLWTDWRGQIASLLGIFALYLGLMVYYPVPGCTAGAWESGCNFARYLDTLALGGHVWRTPIGNDPDGIMSVLLSTTSVLFGILMGQLVLGRTPARLRTPPASSSCHWAWPFHTGSRSPRYCGHRPTAFSWPDCLRSPLGLSIGSWRSVASLEDSGHSSSLG